MNIQREHGFAMSTLALLVCFTLAACSQNPQASNDGDRTNAKPGLFSTLFSSTKPITVPDGTDLPVARVSKRGRYGQALLTFGARVYAVSTRSGEGPCGKCPMPVTAALISAGVRMQQPSAGSI